tara:strand:- start:16971 stop:21500 length:4530 start_codon:yes stop_codon:yes gene_type:complete
VEKPLSNVMNIERTLYEKSYEHDACGVGFVADIEGKRSNKILQKGLEAVINLTHRGAVGGDKKTGDGAGVLTQLPFELFDEFLSKEDIDQITIGNFGVGMYFLPRKENLTHKKSLNLIEKILKEKDIKLIASREVPVNDFALGERALESKPDIFQFFVKDVNFTNQNDFERKLYSLRKTIASQSEKNKLDEVYCCSFSSKSIIYKGMLQAHQLDQFFLDLRNPNYKTNKVMFHQRYSTNTFPEWKLAQPFRFLAHNGEINTIKGNTNWMMAREKECFSEVWKNNINDITPFIMPGGSDSAELDNALELMSLTNGDVLKSISMLIPEAYEKDPSFDPKLKSFYETTSCIVEPWDGPAALVFTDGNILGAALDRNGLRPVRYHITKDNMIVLGSEAGMVRIDPSEIVRSGRIAPGKMIAIDTERKILLSNSEIKSEIYNKFDYEKWTSENFHSITKIVSSNKESYSKENIDSEKLLLLQKAFGYSLEDLERLFEPMSLTGKEPIGSMGDDTPIAALSSKPQSVFNYFKQSFAQVTNPPIDPYREDSVMSLRVILGDKSSFFNIENAKNQFYYFDSPVLTNNELNFIKNFNNSNLKVSEIDTTFFISKRSDLTKSISQITDKVLENVRKGSNIIILSDRELNKEKAAVPIQILVSNIHNSLIQNGLRMKTSIIVESGEIKEDHHVCCLLGYGASAVYPYLAFESVKNWMSKFDGNQDEYLANYKLGLERGILKVLSKMGISTVASYTGSQIFEIVGIDSKTVNRFFPGTVTRIEGVSLKNIEKDIMTLHSNAFSDDKIDKLKEEGIYRFRKDGEYHSLNPPIFKALRKLSKTASYEDYVKFNDLHDSRPPSLIRDLFELESKGSISIDEVESEEEIMKRFRTGAMSHGALSTEAHEAVAIAMNRIGGKSNSGEGGENSDRFETDENGDSKNSSIKQVASGRFGVTPEYLSSANQIEIKMAQGAKPGEGGQIPGNKVTEEIASQRNSIPGVGLISPPPHHDIYSIEDLAQLIYDLKHANVNAKVGVKLVSEVGVGTVAAGVAKGYADYIQISGCEGGTGASPLGSIKHAGIPWEMGLSETHQVLVMNDLRGRVTLTVDGGFQRGFDVVVAAILGAEEFGFGTSVLVALGCVMARQCHLNTCPVGIASQKPELREKFPGIPEQAVNYLYSVANDVRAILAKIGVKSLDDIIGRTELIKQKTKANYNKTKNIDLSRIIADPDPSNLKPRKRVIERNNRVEDPIDFELINFFRKSIDELVSNKIELNISTVDRTVGAILSGAIAKKYGNKGLPDDTINVSFKGIAGQSFGGYLINGVNLNLEGEANDYVGKSMNGGRIAIYPNSSTNFDIQGNSIVGNTVLYGATGGSLFAAGAAGERFCVRNSGALTVVEGVGDHACEYMTGGEVYILGPVGKNLGAGMSGGITYIYNENQNLDEQINPEMVFIDEISDRDKIKIRNIVELHYDLTRSLKAKEILENFDVEIKSFVRIIPKEINRILDLNGINIDDFDFLNPKLN